MAAAELEMRNLVNALFKWTHCFSLFSVVAQVAPASADWCHFWLTAIARYSQAQGYCCCPLFRLNCGPVPKAIPSSI